MLRNSVFPGVVLRCWMVKRTKILEEEIFRTDCYILLQFQALAKEQGRNAVDVAPQCENFGKSLCSSSPCKHGGRCQEGWNRFLCDCSATPFSGPTCELG